MNDWRSELERKRENGMAAERYALEHGLENFCIRVDWGTVAIDYCHGNTIQDFQEMVQSTSVKIGPPESVKGESWINLGGDRAPDLIARWPRVAVDGVEVDIFVRVLCPQGCKIKPGTGGVTYDQVKEADLSDDCESILDDLRNLPVGNASDA